jgi:cation-transporting P-type ATPase E
MHQTDETHNGRPAVRLSVAPETEYSLGLSDEEASARRARGQGNVITLQTSRSYTQIIRENVFTFINNVLFVLGIALIALGRISDAIVSVAVVLFNVLVSVVQEVRAKRTLDHIALLTRPRATVIRNGAERQVPPDQVVVGDLLVVRPGDQIVVDGPIVGEGPIEVDESMLTGESDLVAKHMGEVVSSGSFCVSGTARYQADKVGEQSAANQITVGARAFRRVLTPLQRQINLVIHVLLLVAVFFEVLVVVGSAFNQVPLVQSVKISVVIAGIVPIGLFLAIAVAYALGAVRMAGQGVLVQQANAVESLSHVNVLCLDKTGTLTANEITFNDVHSLGMDEGELRRLLGDYAASVTSGNRTSEAIAAACAGQARHLHDEVPFSSARKWSALAFDDAALQGTYVLGALEMLSPHLSTEINLAAQASTWTGQGLRVVLFACTPELASLHDLGGQPRLPDKLTPLGFVTFSDLLRPEARATLASFTEAGVQAKIISGDHPDTVAALAKQAGFSTDIQVVSGLDLAALDEAQLAQVAEQATVFGRITPQQKEQLVRMLRKQEHYVAMIGDGVNDVLSLKQADLGIAMQNGSQATRAVADIVLLNDSFAPMPRAVQEGQRIVHGMQEILKLFLTRMLFMVLLFVATAVAGDVFPFEPKQHSIFSFFAGGIPALALAAWAVSRPVNRRSITRSLVHFVVPAGLTLSLVGLLVSLGIGRASANTFIALHPAASQLEVFQYVTPIEQTALTTFAVFGSLLLVLFVVPPSRIWTGGASLNGDWRPVLLVGGLLLAYVVILALAPLRTLFELTPLGLLHYLILGGAAVLWAVVLWGMWRVRLIERFLELES